MATRGTTPKKPGGLAKSAAKAGKFGVSAKAGSGSFMGQVRKQASTMQGNPAAAKKLIARAEKYKAKTTGSSVTAKQQNQNARAVRSAGGSKGGNKITGK